MDTTNIDDNVKALLVIHPSRHFGPGAIRD